MPKNSRNSSGRRPAAPKPLVTPGPSTPATDTVEQVASNQTPEIEAKTESAIQIPIESEADSGSIGGDIQSEPVSDRSLLMDHEAPNGWGFAIFQVAQGAGEPNRLEAIFENEPEPGVSMKIVVSTATTEVNDFITELDARFIHDEETTVGEPDATEPSSTPDKAGLDKVTEPSPDEFSHTDAQILEYVDQLTPSQFDFVQLVLMSVKAFKAFKFPLPQRMCSIDQVRCEWIPVDELNKVGFHIYNSALNNYGQPSANNKSNGYRALLSSTVADIERLQVSLNKFQGDYDDLQETYEKRLALNIELRAAGEPEQSDPEFHDRANAAESLNQAKARMKSLKAVKARVKSEMKAENVQPVERPEFIKDLFFEISL